MFYSPVQYIEPVFRPPGEANSVIIQATIGCSWNKCAFCEMYTSKKFKVRDPNDVLADLKALSNYYSNIRKVFLADGNAFALSAGKLLFLLNEINKNFGQIQRVSSYALPKDILKKSDAELKELRSLGLKLLYVGIETGDDELLKLINKSESYYSTLDGVLKAQQAGIETSVMILNGLGGEKYTEQHALNSAKIINAINPKFLSTLTLSLPYGEAHFKNRFKGEYVPQTIGGLFGELKLFIENIQGENIIYRSDHVSNNLILKGVLGRDKVKIVKLIENAMGLSSINNFPVTRGIL